MKAIYETKGRAREYFELAANLYRGCDHHCAYCYAPDAIKLDRQAFGEPAPRPGILEALYKDASKLALAGECRHILMSFSTDPYNHLDESLALTREAIKVLKGQHLK